LARKLHNHRITFISGNALLSDWLQRLERLFMAVAFAESGEAETALAIAYGTGKPGDVGA
jgi:hypothetical protein